MAKHRQLQLSRLLNTKVAITKTQCAGPPKCQPNVLLRRRPTPTLPNATEIVAAQLSAERNARRKRRTVAATVQAQVKPPLVPFPEIPVTMGRVRHALGLRSVEQLPAKMLTMWLVPCESCFLVFSRRSSQVIRCCLKDASFRLSITDGAPSAYSKCPSPSCIGDAERVSPVLDPADALSW